MNARASVVAATVAAAVSAGAVSWWQRAPTIDVAGVKVFWHGTPPYPVGEVTHLVQAIHDAGAGVCPAGFDAHWAGKVYLVGPDEPLQRGHRVPGAGCIVSLPHAPHLLGTGIVEELGRCVFVVCRSEGEAIPAAWVEAIKIDHRRAFPGD